MKDIRVAYGVAILTVLLLFANLWNAYPNDFDLGFWLRTVANILILISMTISIRHNRRNKKES
ncbi:hypothetical protein C8P64_2622 [Christiangramia gaetbulicola]|uniref:Uncharacterized protein n=1 Tax=Christiangramia gaetbulicola TaxID=703340 RepID=A0A2T6AEF7_9FLAO|nr:hypothetical protein C8P64_2622 [Christiangramia gaetbulicola]